MAGLLAYCRQGFEPELAAELSTRAAKVGYPGYARTERNSGYVVLVADDSAALNHALPWRDLIFARQKMQLLGELKGLDPSDRISPIVQLLHHYHPPAVTGTTEAERRPAYGEVWVEHPDSDAAKPLAGLARSFANALRPALRRQGLLSARENPRLPRLHVVFVDGQHAFVGRNEAGDGAPWPLGIPRLKLLPDAPSRSALKLEEALLSLLDGQQREQLLKAGMTAADLGAAPGGWTWVLTRQHLRVSSIDNGPLRQHVMDTGLVEHLRADGFHWKPEKPLDWMVCDMVEQPRRVAERMATWFREGWCRHAVFNLKLPMKKRWDETALCLDLFEQQAGRRLDIRAKQLYHDREEITVFATTSSTR
ncbi:23S rRNA (cytidine(2498)-2'-O)-methyltransferase RlmM [Pseudoxanthomonas dokdonensis]|uniref:Ribosomal RNA large subunit methyltransferase M n=1 Tax=Pseudoxanthomonas dokdonensis TaxID=344882 RepID=A0A0R0CNW4_9GAMM|nr:23S rRNA (cytidine(2498)-2'-O)-methyltransferase RlmM [Pseudoxanthomonas dokdonensis]KRG71243.1 23S rRNA methyltransferase [Pseudoxanthomonas dokdonensis]